MKITEIVWFPGYGVTRDGRTWTKRLKGRKKNGQDRIGTEWRELKQKTMKRGYKIVDLCIDNKYTRFLVQRLMLLVYEGPPPTERYEACHKNDVHGDNRIENLYWGTRKTNMEDAVRNGRTTKGEKNPRAVLTAEDVQRIVALWKTTRLSQQEIGERFGVGQTTVSLIVVGRTWSHVTGIQKQRL